MRFKPSFTPTKKLPLSEFVIPYLPPSAVLQLQFHSVNLTFENPPTVFLTYKNGMGKSILFKHTKF